MATIRPDEITSIIKAKIENYNSEMEVSNVGSVLEVGDGIARVYGLRNAMSNELVEFEDGNGTLGMALNLEENNVGVVILGDYTHIKEGMTVKTTGRIEKYRNISSFVRTLPSASESHRNHAFARGLNFRYYHRWRISLRPEDN